MVDKEKEFRDRLKVENYEYEGSVDFLEEELLKKEFDGMGKNVRRNNKHYKPEPIEETIKWALDELR